MNNPGKEKNKLILIGVLVVLFFLVAYVRFFHPTGIHGTGSPVAPSGESTAVIPLPGMETGLNRDAPGNGPPAANKITRDIFAPGRVEFATGNAKASPQEAPEVPPPPPSFKLNGVIADQGSAMAVINGKFLKKGDWIEGYQVISIDDSQVMLNGSSGQKVVLQLLKTIGK